jgi:hypothetical protein
VSKTRYIYQKEATQLLRKALKGAFPGQKFSVRMARGTNGIDVRWTDGPTCKEVQGVLGGFDGTGFDGMIDMSYSRNSWLNPETGEAAFAYTEGTGGSMGSVSAHAAENPWPGVGILVHFCTGYLSAVRTISRALIDQVSAEVEADFGHPPPAIEQYGKDCSYSPDFSYDEGWIYRHYAEALENKSAYVKPAQEPHRAKEQDR